MSIDESQLTAAVAHVDDPELRRPLGELGMVGGVRCKRKKATVELLLPVALCYAFTEGRRRAVYMVIAAVMYTSVVASASRMGFTLVTVEMFAVPVLLMRSGQTGLKRVGWAGLTILGMVLVLGIAMGPEMLAARLAVADPYAIRREFAYSSFNMIAAHPFVGIGLGNWPAVYPAYALFDDGLFANQAHNDWLQWTAEGGLPYLALMLWVAGYSMKNAMRSGWGVGVCIVFLHCLVDYPIQRMAVALVFFIVMAAANCTPASEVPTGHRTSLKRCISPVCVAF